MYLGPPRLVSCHGEGAWPADLCCRVFVCHGRIFCNGAHPDAADVRCMLVTMFPRFRERTSGKEKKKMRKPAHSEEEGGEKSTHRETASLRILVYRDQAPR